LTLLDEVAVFVILSEQVASNSRSNFSVGGAVQLRYPFLKDRNILLHNLDELDLGRSHLGARFFFFTTREYECDHAQAGNS
jgi:hypothetical protein